MSSLKEIKEIGIEKFIKLVLEQSDTRIKEDFNLSENENFETQIDNFEKYDYCDINYEIMFNDLKDI